MGLTKASYALIDSAPISVLDYGADPTGGVDSTTAIQAALDYLRDNGGTLVFPYGTYTISAQLTLQRSSASHSEKWVIEGNSSRIQSSFNGEIFKIGATSISYFTSRGSIVINDLFVQGSETENGSSVGVNPTYSQTGIYLYCASTVELNNIHVYRCKTGIRTHFVFPLKAISCSVRGCWVGCHLDESSNLQAWDNLYTPSTRYGILIKSTTTSFDSGKTNNVTFTKWWPEGSQVGMVIDSGSGGSGATPIKSISVIDPYAALITYDIIRMGTVYDFATPQTRGANCSEQITDVRFTDGLWNNTYSATSSAFAFDSSQRVNQIYIDAPIPDLDVEPLSWVNTTGGGIISARGQATTAQEGNTTKYFYNKTGVLTRKETPDGSIEFLASTGIQFPTGAGISSSLFDDYEEGAFTPTIIGTSSAGTGSYSAQVATYTKIGNRVSFDINLTWTGHTGTGSLRIAGLPYTPVTSLFSSLSISQFSNIALTASTVASAAVRDDASEIFFIELLVGGGASGVVAMDAAGTIRLSGVYAV
tara:strand:+ start:34 stop:1632 length:1599 start_codon:yes stop_codon:yes gene_type:complete